MSRLIHAVFRFVLLSGCGVALRAHDPGLSTAEATLGLQRVHIVTGFAPDDANEFLPETLKLAGSWSETDFARVNATLDKVAGELWAAEINGERLPVESASVQLLPEDNVSFEVAFTAGGREGTLVLRALKIGDLPGGHRQFLIVYDAAGSAVTRKLLSAKDTILEVPEVGNVGRGSEPLTVTTPDSAGAATFADFLRLGVEHIWTGYDHLLFLFALLIVCQTFRSSVAIISCFTVAHSITLGLATLDVLSLPGALVEPLIAASIIFVGVENLLRRGEEPPRRWLLTFAFGLVHGFGFAGVLRDLGIGRHDTSALVMPLLSFNLGVELGQIVIAAAVLPLVWRLRRNPRFIERGVPLLSAMVALAGAYWLVERTLW